ncbi:MAG: N-acetylmuramoyl-L-alanine amidase [Acidobacteriota bacterium]|nr:N-acetylmuramoyl-L-alanine amidase [Acidobacteriota bacterium]
MLRAAKGVRQMFACVSPFFVFLSCLAAFPAAPANSAAEPTASVKRQAAVQFERAEQQREALNVKPAPKRILADYRQVVSSYRRVYLITPRATEVPDALLAISQLYTEMGEHFGRNYYQSAVDAYHFLLREYPTSRYGPDAMLACAKIQRDQLGDYSSATQTYQNFLKRYPRSSRKREAQEGVAELALLQHGAKPAPAPAPAGSPLTAASLPSDENISDLPPLSPASGAARGIPRVRRIRASATDDSARVTIDLESVVAYSSGRLAKPDRIFFDLRDARIPLEVARESVKVDGDILTAVRAAQNQNHTVRVVLDVDHVKEYGVSTTDNPPQLLIDLFRKSLPASAAKVARASHTSDMKRAPVESLLARADEAAVEAVNVKSEATPRNLPPVTPAAAGPAPKNSKSAAKSDFDPPAAPPQPTRDGHSTLTRALGLKIGRIVIDAGHGGHDTGTIGPTGLMEKDLCLDVALRLGKIIKQRLPGAEVVFTRADDSFIPLEERTAIANEAHADLFISIHANSSQDHGARGIETYYLNLKGSPEAMEVAARENAVSNVGVHDLEDLIKKIARNEKIDESREFAEDIQNSLASRVQKTAKTVKNRGVRKAPFVVLIGADMPSILTEISFLSNPADEQLLKKPEHRQRVAEGLYQGVASYLQSLNSVTLNMPPSTAPQSTSAKASRRASAKLEQSRNEQ